MIPLFLTLMLSFLPMTSISSLLGADKAAKYEENHTTWVYPPWEHSWGVVRATQVHLTLYSLGSSNFINPQGLAAVRLEATDDPNDHKDDDEITVYGVNSGENTIIYNKSMTSLGFYSGRNIPDKPLNTPWDIAALPNGLLFLTDSGNRRVVKLRNVQAELRFEKAFGNEDSVNLILPRGIAVTGGGRVVVADAGSGRIVLFDTLGVKTGELTGFDRPVGLAAVDWETPFTRPTSSYIVVSDSGGQRIRKVDYEGKVLHEVDVARATGLKNPYVGHLETDYYHNVIATDSVNHCILKFDNQLAFLSAWGEKGSGRSRFTSPTGITMWRRLGQTFVAEQGGAHYLWVGVDFTRPPRLSIEKGPLIRLHLGLTEKSTITLKLVDKRGTVVRELEVTRAAGDQEVNWLLDRDLASAKLDSDGAVKQGKTGFPEPGLYTLQIHLRASYSSRKSFEKVVETQVRLTPDHYSE